MEENKNCCEKPCEKNEHCCAMGKCCMWKKCPTMKHLIWLVIIIVIFCLGAQFGELKSQARGYHNYRGEMMNWDYKIVKPLTTETISDIPIVTTPEVIQ